MKTNVLSLLKNIKNVFSTFKRNPHIGDIVYYNDKKCILIRETDDSYWDLKNVSNEKIYKGVYKKSFKMLPLWKR